MGGTGRLSVYLKTGRLAFICSILLALLTLAGCGPSRDPYLARVQEAGVLRVGLDPSWPPFEFVDPKSGELAGLDVDLARAIGRELGVEVAFVVSGWEGLYGALLAGQFDAILSALPYDPWRTQEALYSISYLNVGPVLVMPGDRAEALGPDVGARELVRALAGWTVHVEFGAEGDVQARRLQNQGAEIEIVTHDTAAAALDAMAASPAGTDAALVDAVSARLYLRTVPPGSAQIAGPPLYDELYVIAVHPDADSLQAAIDQALTDLRESGELDALLDRWL